MLSFTIIGALICFLLNEYENKKKNLKENNYENKIYLNLNIFGRPNVTILAF